MVLKRLAELTTDELMSEFGKAGFEEEFSESLALVKLTIYLVGSGVDPFNFLYNVPVKEVIEKRSVNLGEFESEVPEDFPTVNPVVLDVGIADEVSAGSFLSEILPSTHSTFVMALEASLSSTDKSSRKTLCRKSVTEVIGRHLHSAHCWVSCSMDKECSVKVSGNCPSCTCPWGYQGSCSVCENWAVKTKEERPDGWPPDNPALCHTMGKWWDTRKYQEMTN